MGYVGVDTGTIITNVSECLRTTIQANIQELKATDAVIFKSPAQFEPTNSLCLLVYLYQIEYNPYLRNAPSQFMTIPSDGGASFSEVRAPAVVDLRYLMTPYAPDPSTELTIIDKLTQLFYNNATLEANQNLIDSDNDHISIVPDSQNLHEVKDLWTSFPGKPYKLSLYYLLSPVRIPSATTNSINRVLQVQNAPIPKDIKEGARDYGT